MDLSKKQNLTRDEQFEIASAMHALILDELFRATGWQHPNAVFHGGTSLKFQWDSLRFSEDLDFLVADDQINQLHSSMNGVRSRVDLALGVMYPGGRISLEAREPKGDASLRRWDFKWSHPNRHGRVFVKTEFFASSKETLNAYKARSFVPTAGAGGIQVTTPITGPDLIASWADKVKAIATRPSIKWRDFYDLAFIASRMDLAGWPSDADLIEAVSVSASIYGKSVYDVHLGLEEVLSSLSEADLPKYEADMRKWLPAESWKSWKNAGYFAAQFKQANKEVSRIAELIPAPGATP